MDAKLKGMIFMTITQEKNGNKLTLHVAGRVDSKTAPELEQVVETALDGVTELVFDFAETLYISSAGLRVLLMAQKRMNDQGEMKVIGSNADLLEIFGVTGFSEMLNIL